MNDAMLTPAKRTELAGLGGITYEVPASLLTPRAAPSQVFFVRSDAEAAADEREGQFIEWTGTAGRLVPNRPVPSRLRSLDGGIMTIHLSEDDKRAIAKARLAAKAHESGGALAVARVTDPDLPEGSPMVYPMAYGAMAWQLGSLLSLIDAHAEPEAGL